MAISQKRWVNKFMCVLVPYLLGPILQFGCAGLDDANDEECENCDSLSTTSVVDIFIDRAHGISYFDEPYAEVKTNQFCDFNSAMNRPRIGRTETAEHTSIWNEEVLSLVSLQGIQDLEFTIWDADINLMDDSVRYDDNIATCFYQPDFDVLDQELDDYNEVKNLLTEASKLTELSQEKYSLPTTLTPDQKRIVLGSIGNVLMDPSLLQSELNKFSKTMTKTIDCQGYTMEFRILPSHGVAVTEERNGRTYSYSSGVCG